MDLRMGLPQVMGSASALKSENKSQISVDRSGTLN